MRPEQYGFEKLDDEAEDSALRGHYRYRDEPLELLELREEAGEAGNYPEACCTDYQLLLWESRGEVRLIFTSRKKKVRALEFLDFLMPEFGLTKGDAACARGQISSVILKVCMAEREQQSSLEFFMDRVRAYFVECICIDAEQYGILHREEILQMERYRKKKISWAFVRSTDAVEAGKQMCIKSLENEAGITVTADENVYIMIGCRGEIYHISREKFERTYETSGEPLDIFEQMLDFIPVIETVPEQEYISIDEIAHLCYPKEAALIFGCLLHQRTKVFPKDAEQEYFLGRPGDYLAIRCDDLSDVYIIQKDVFRQTYEAVQT